MPKKTTSNFLWNKKHDDLLNKLAIEITKNKRWVKVAEGFKNEILKESPEIKSFPTRVQCRDRWVNYLDESLSREPFTDEQLIYIRNRKKDGLKFVAIAKELNHSPNQVKNAYYSKTKNIKQSLKAKKDTTDGGLVYSNLLQNYGVFDTQSLDPDNEILKTAGLEEEATMIMENNNFFKY